MKTALSLMYQYLQSIIFNTLQVNTSYAFLSALPCIPYKYTLGAKNARKNPRKKVKI